MSEKAAPKRVVVPNEQYEEVVAQLRNLRSAVERIYYAAVWHADRPIEEYVPAKNEYGDHEPAGNYEVVGEAALWEALRDAAGFRHGNSPTELPYSGVRADFPLNKLRLLAETVRKSEFSTEQTNAFLSLYREELEQRVNAAVRKFFEEKLG